MRVLSIKYSQQAAETAPARAEDDPDAATEAAVVATHRVDVPHRPPGAPPPQPARRRIRTRCGARSQRPQAHEQGQAVSSPTRQGKRAISSRTRALKKEVGAMDSAGRSQKIAASPAFRVSVSFWYGTHVDRSYQSVSSDVGR